MTLADSPVLVSTEENGIMNVTLNRPGAMNALNSQMKTDLTAAIDRAGDDRSVRVVVIKGAGDRAFCAGADIKEFAEPSSITGERLEKRKRKWTDAIAECPKPTLAAIQGYCLGGGLEIALACDIRIAAESAIFGLPEVRLGIIPGAGGTQRLPRVVGLGYAMEIILGGERFDAEKALRIGLVSGVFRQAALESEVGAMAEALSLGAPIALQYAKESMLRGFDLPLDQGLQIETDLATMLMSTSDRLEGADAFKARRSPEFRGQ